MGLFRATLIFGSAAVALALLAVPYVEDRASVRNVSSARSMGLDMNSTGSIMRGDRYIERRSVLQSTPVAICVIRPDGSRSGDC